MTNLPGVKSSDILTNAEIHEILRLGRCPDCVHLILFEDAESHWCLFPECRCGRDE